MKTNILNFKIMKYIKLLFVLSVISLLYNCQPDWKKQQDFLLPPNNKLKLISNLNNDISVTNVFAVSGDLNPDDLDGYLLQKIRGKAIKTWHKPPAQETADIKKFFKNEPIDVSISGKITESIRKGTCYIAYMFNNNEADQLPGQKDYNTMNWGDMYFLDIDSKELIHISFGKF